MNLYQQPCYRQADTEKSMSLSHLSLQGRNQNVSHTLARKEVAHHHFIRLSRRSSAPVASAPWQHEYSADNAQRVAGEQSLS